MYECVLRFNVRNYTDQKLPTTVHISLGSENELLTFSIFWFEGLEGAVQMCINELQAGMGEGQ